MFIDNTNTMLLNNSPILEPYEGFLKGNIFKNIYDQFKNFIPSKIVPNNEQAELLLNVDQICFIVHELNLYLDVFPDDKDMISMFNKYLLMEKDAVSKYEKKYGPLNVNSIESNTSNFTWENTSWPWEDK